MFLLDTNVISELRKVRCDQRVRDWVARQDPSAMHLSVVVVLELEYGVALVERRDRHQGSVLRAWLQDAVLPAFSGKVLDVTLPIVRTCAAMQARGLRSLADALIAATASQHRLTVVTRNVGDFEGSGIAVHNPWTG